MIPSLWSCLGLFPKAVFNLSTASDCFLCRRNHEVFFISKSQGLVCSFPAEILLIIRIHSLARLLTKSFLLAQLTLHHLQSFLQHVSPFVNSFSLVRSGLSQIFTFMRQLSWTVAHSAYLCAFGIHFLMAPRVPLLSNTDYKG